MIIIVSKYLLPKGYTGMAIFPFVLLREERLCQNKVLLNHEKIHLRQQAELLILPFYLWYVTEYFIRLILYKDKYKAYRNISFEREAYSNEHKTDYLKQRGLWNFFKYISTTQ